MTKENIKKIIIIICLITFLGFFFLFINNYRESRYNNNISLVKRIINHKYSDIIYMNNSDYIYGYHIEDNRYIYDVYDLNGNKLYSFNSNEALNIVSVRKKYFIVKEDKYYLYDKDYKEITKEDKIKDLTDYILLKNNKIINVNNKVLYNDVNEINSYDNNNYFLINNNFLIDKKGKKVLDDLSFVSEFKSKDNTIFLIVKKDKYYTFFPSIGKKLGDGFDSYYACDSLYVYKDNIKYVIYKNGLRKRVEEYNITDDITSKYDINNENIINKKILFASKKSDNTCGVLNLKNKKYKKLSTVICNIKKINDDNYLIKDIDNNYIYNYKEDKIVYESNKYLDEIIMYKDYISLKNDNKYELVDLKGKVITSSENQIALLNKNIEYGLINDVVTLYDLDNKTKYTSSSIIINDKKYYRYNKSNKKLIVNLEDNKEYSSSYEILNTNDSLVFKEDNSLKILSLKNNKEKYYELKEDEENINVLDNVIIIEFKDKISILDSEGKEISDIKNSKIDRFSLNKMGKVIIITKKEKDNILLKGSYLAE